MIDRPDAVMLLETPAFRRFLFGFLETGGLFETSATAGDGRTLFLEGRRSLVIDVLRALEAVQPLPAEGAIPMQTLIQTLRERVHSPRKENDFDRRHDAYAELRGD